MEEIKQTASASKLIISATPETNLTTAYGTILLVRALENSFTNALRLLCAAYVIIALLV